MKTHQNSIYATYMLRQRRRRGWSSRTICQVSLGTKRGSSSPAISIMAKIAAQKGRLGSVSFARKPSLVICSRKSHWSSTNFGSSTPFAPKQVEIPYRSYCPPLSNYAGQANQPHRCGRQRRFDKESPCGALYVCMYVRTYVRMYVCTYVCMYACMHVCMYACMDVCYVMLCYVMYVCMCMYVCMYVCVCMSVCLYVCMSVCLYVCMPVCLSACLPVCLSACLPVCLYVCMYVMYVM